VSGPAYHARTHRPKYLGGTDPTTHAEWHVKVFADDEVVDAADTRVPFVWLVPSSLDGCYVRDLAAMISTVSSSGDVVISVENLGPGDGIGSVTFDPIQIDQGDFHSYDSGSPMQIGSSPQGLLTRGDRLSFSIDSDGTGAKGLLVIVVAA